MTVRFYSSVAAETTLTGAITNASTSATIASAVGLPSSTPFTMALDYESAGEELVEVTAVAGTNLTITRGIDGTSATSHNAGARVRHVASARDYADSRSHENADDGIHGLAPGEEIVGTDRVQTLSNKTLNMATGTLSRINIFNDDTGGAWTTGVFGDSGTPNQSLMEWKPTSVANRVANVGANGQYIQRNKSATEDASISLTQFGTFKSDGATPIWRVFSGGEVKANLTTGANGYTVVPASDVTSQFVFRSRNAADAINRVQILSDGSMDINGNDPNTNQLDVVAAPSQSGSFAVLRVRDSTPTTKFAVFHTGTVDADRYRSDITTVPGLEIQDSVGASSDRYVVFQNTAGTEVGSIRRGMDLYTQRIFQHSTGISYRTQQTDVTTTNFTAENSKIVPVVFPIAFPTTPNVVATKNSAPGGSRSIIVSAINTTNVGFDMLFQTADGLNTTFTGLDAVWVATGAT